MQVAMLRPLSVKEYLEGEERADIRHEYVAGQVYAMAGAKLRHNQIAGNLYGLLWQKARGSHCQVLNSDMKVRVEAVDAFYYPDVALRCGAPLSGDTLYLEDPCLIVEVLSASTANVDRREKLQAYQTLPSLQEYVLVDSEKTVVEVFRRHPEGWWYELLNDPESDRLRCQCVDLALSVGDIYAGVDLPSALQTD
ncbi:Uma2 family endonuclease [Acidithiobacillus sulfurivorans]|uniref:Uma2 family endonuclease n=1 Tax=Acidithiobacillus sulfurivorans TaxID=1958756 RepID=A0ABS5ZZL4_9PROT|nr:Uma2 family endonuclease [Acidithiobacillus sulfurivorans]MBU2760673.1 Uma2 family endonuclease [Acidithiobacillus sulfurivorans]